VSEHAGSMLAKDNSTSPASAAAVRQEWSLQLGLIAIAAAGIIAAMFFTPNFLTIDNFRAIMRNAATVGVVAVAMTPMTLSGNFVSLAITQTAMAAMVAFVVLIGLGVPQFVAMIVVVAGTVVVGMMQGIVVAAGLNPVITTLAAGAIVFGVVSQATGGGIVRVGSHPLSWGAGSLAGVPIEVIVFVLFTIVVTLLMSSTVMGRETILVGANRATAEVSGISFVRVTLGAFVVFSVGLAIAGILSGAAFGQATAQSFPGLTISVIAAVLVGGTAIQGGQGSPLRSAIGAVIISVISNMMVLNNFSTGGRLALQGGAVVAIVVLLDLLRRRGAVRT
jgi:ribose transport system permease protein